MTLSGVLKDILLVLASMVIFGDPVTPTQFFGYAIALAGLVYYKLGPDRIGSYAAQGKQSWREYGATNPAMRKVVVFAGALVVIFVVLGGLRGYSRGSGVGVGTGMGMGMASPVEEKIGGAA